jgi:hypothetical protein
MKRSVARAVLILIVILGILINNAVAQTPAVVTDNDPGWHKIGEITASFKMESESIIVFGRDEFTKIRMNVVDAPINIQKIKIYFEEGDEQEIEVMQELRPGAMSKVIDLTGVQKELNKVVFTYKSIPNSGMDRAKVELYGLKTRKDRSDAFRDKDDDDEGKVERKSEEGVQEVDEATHETRREIKEESREAKREAKETEKDLKEESREAKEELKDSEKTDDDNDVAEFAGNAVSHIKDKVYVDKTGPDGETIYIDKHSRYYFINDDGEKVFVAKTKLKDRKKD